MVCPECKSRFNSVERIKSMSRKNGKIQCESCKSIFLRKENSGRIVSALVVGVSVFISSLIGSSIRREYSENSILVALIISLTMAFIVFIFYFMSQNFWKYERENSELEK